MRQVLPRNLRPGDTIESVHGAARVTDVPATCYEDGRILVSVPVTTTWRSRELTFAPTDFVPVIDNPFPSVMTPLSIFAATVLAAGALAGTSTSGFDHSRDNEAHTHVGHHQHR